MNRTFDSTLLCFNKTTKKLELVQVNYQLQDCIALILFHTLWYMLNYASQIHYRVQRAYENQLKALVFTNFMLENVSHRCFAHLHNQDMTAVISKASSHHHPSTIFIHMHVHIHIHTQIYFANKSYDIKEIEDAVLNTVLA